MDLRLRRRSFFFLQSRSPFSPRDTELRIAFAPSHGHHAANTARPGRTYTGLIQNRGIAFAPCMAAMLRTTRSGELTPALHRFRFIPLLLLLRSTSALCLL